MKTNTMETIIKERKAFLFKGSETSQYIQELYNQGKIDLVDLAWATTFISKEVEGFRMMKDSLRLIAYYLRHTTQTVMESLERVLANDEKHRLYLFLMSKKLSGWLKARPQTCPSISVIDNELWKLYEYFAKHPERNPKPVLALIQRVCQPKK